jgi:hypothetical protein
MFRLLLHRRGALMKRDSTSLSARYRETRPYLSRSAAAIGRRRDDPQQRRELGAPPDRHPLSRQNAMPARSRPVTEADRPSSLRDDRDDRALRHVHCS